MPRGKKDDKNKSDPNAGRRYFTSSEAAWGGYVDLKLDADQHATFDDWFHATNAEWPVLLTDALAEGLSLSVKWDAASQCFVASLAGAGVSNSNERYVLTARSTDMFEAMALSVYKHSILMRGDWGDYKPRTGRLAQWG